MREMIMDQEVVMDMDITDRNLDMKDLVLTDLGMMNMRTPAQVGVWSSQYTRRMADHVVIRPIMLDIHLNTSLCRGNKDIANKNTLCNLCTCCKNQADSLTTSEALHLPV